jgi:hypothetical protein
MTELNFVQKEFKILERPGKGGNVALCLPLSEGLPMDEAFMKERALHIRNLAEKADPSIKRRLLDVAVSYENRLGRSSQATVRLLSNLPSEKNLDY